MQVETQQCLVPLELLEVEAAVVADRLACDLHLPGAGDADFLGWASKGCVSQKEVRMADPSTR